MPKSKKKTPAAATDMLRATLARRIRQMAADENKSIPKVVAEIIARMGVDDDDDDVIVLTLEAMLLLHAEDLQRGAA